MSHTKEIMGYFMHLTAYYSFKRFVKMKMHFIYLKLFHFRHL